MGTIQISGLNSKSTFDSTDVIAIESNGVTYKVSGSTLASALKTLGNYLNTASLVANLTTTTAGSPLDATQGKALADMISNRIGAVNAGSYSTLTDAATDIFTAMGYPAVKVGTFTRTGIGVYVFIAFTNSANYATMLCWSYSSSKITQVNNVNGTYTTLEYLPN